MLLNFDCNLQIEIYINLFFWLAIYFCFVFFFLFYNLQSFLAEEYSKIGSAVTWIQLKKRNQFSGNLQFIIRSSLVLFLFVYNQYSRILTIDFLYKKKNLKFITSFTELNNIFSYILLKTSKLSKIYQTHIEYI